MCAADLGLERPFCMQTASTRETKPSGMQTDMKTCERTKLLLDEIKGCGLMGCPKIAFDKPVESGLECNFSLGAKLHKHAQDMLLREARSALSIYLA